MEFVKFEELFGVKEVGELDDLLCERNVCSNKVMCFFSKDKKFVLKEMRKSFNEGNDCMVLDDLKDLFGINKIGMYRIKSDKRVYRINVKEKYWEGNMKFIEEDVVYLVMNNFENVGSLVKNKNVLKESKNEFLKIMMFRGIFRVSDGNMSNCLVGKDGKLVSIDENNIGNRKNILNMKFNYNDYENNDYNKVLKDLRENCDIKIIEIKLVMKKYGFGEDMINVVLKNYDNLEEDIYKDIEIYINKKKEKKIVKVVKKKIVKEVVKKELKINSMGDYRRVGVFNSVSFNGYKCDLMKSCFQKYVRRNVFEKGVYCLFELDLFKGFVYEVNGKMYSGKGIRSNMRNRMLVMLGEDLDYDWKVYMKMNKWFDEWEKNRDGDSDIDRVYLINIYKLLCDSKKSRMGSYLRGSFCIGYKIEGIKEKYSEFYENFEECEENKGKMFYKSGDSVELKKYLDGFVGMIEKGDDRVFYWFFKIFYYEGEIGRRNRRKKSMFVIMDVMEKLIKGGSKLVVKESNLEKLYKIVLKWIINNNNSRNECWLWIVGLIKFYMNKGIDWEEVVDYEMKLDIEDVKKYMKKNLNKEKIEIDDFCIDMHVCEGREKGMDGMDFWKEGGVVFDEVNIVEMYKNIYGDIKMKNY